MDLLPEDVRANICPICHSKFKTIRGMIYPHEHSADSYQCVAAWHLLDDVEAEKPDLTIADKIWLRDQYIGFN